MKSLQNWSVPFMLLLDGYKLDHRRQYPDKTEYVYSNYTARGTRLKGQTFAVAFGLQGMLKHYLGEYVQAMFFERPLDEVINEYQEMLDDYLGPNSIGTDHIAALHELGYLPLEFHAVPEGTKVPLNMPIFTVINTHPDFFWLTNYIETLLASTMWMAINSATIADRLRVLLENAAQDQEYDPEFVQWQAHDFSFRGISGPEAAMVSGAAHLLSFSGTDTVPAIQWLRHYYNTTGFVGGSVAATEHSVMCAGGKVSEAETFQRLMSLYPTGILSVVSDTWDLWHVLTDIVPDLKDEIMNRDGKLVIRPDSGDPVDIVCGNPNFLAGTPENKGVVELLWETFGGTATPKGYRVLDRHIGVIYGDAITENRMIEIRDRLADKSFALSNMVFGVGSFTYQYNTRDTLGQAMKATWTQIDGQEHMLEKDPVTDDGVKKSATGMIQLITDKYFPLGIRMDQGLNREQWLESFDNDGLLQPVWRDGKFLRESTLEEVRDRIRRTNNSFVTV